MKELKSLAEAMAAALSAKGITIKHGQALDVLAVLSGTKDWNALNAVLQQRRSTLALRQALQGLLGAADSLAARAGDTPEWSDGGFAREACKKARTALAGLPESEELDGSVDYVMAVDAADQRLWIGVDNISVYIRRNDEGVSVDLYPMGAEDGESLAGTWALFQDAEADEPAAGDHSQAFEEFPQTWVIFSRSEEDISGDAGFWSNEFGWSLREHATLFNSREKAVFDLPYSAGNDAVWVGLLKPFRVSLTELGESDPILFECHAEDVDHATEQAENAYPGCAVHLAEVVTTPRASTIDSHVRKVYDLIASAKAWEFDDSPVITDVVLDELRGDPENEVFYFTWAVDDELYSEKITEEDLARCTLREDGMLLFPDADGGPMSLRCFGLVAAQALQPKSKGVPHICGYPGEHGGDCPACAEAKVAARDLAAEWVGQHYGVNFDAESATRKDEWIARFMEAHSTDNPLFPLSDWEYEVENGDTRVGYAEWLSDKLESQHHDRDSGVLDTNE